MKNKLAGFQHLTAVSQGVRGFLDFVFASVIEALEELETTKSDKPEVISLTIPTERWELDPENSENQPYPYHLTLTLGGITSQDIVTVTLSPESHETALACGLCPTNQSFEGVLVLRACKVPEREMIAEYHIMQGKEEETWHMEA